MLVHDNDKIIKFETILEEAEKISGIDKKKLSAAYDAISQAKMELYYSKKDEVFARGGNLILQMPDNLDFLSKEESFIDKKGNEIPPSTSVSFHPSEKYMKSLNNKIN